MQLAAKCRACGIFNILEYVNTHVSTTGTTLILSFLVSEFDKESKFGIVWVEKGGGWCAETKIVCQTGGGGGEEGVTA